MRFHYHPGAGAPGPRPSPLRVGLLPAQALSQARAPSCRTSMSGCLCEATSHCTLPAQGRMLVLWLVGLEAPSSAHCTVVVPTPSDGGREALCTRWVGRALVPEVIQFRSGFRAGLGPAMLPAGLTPAVGRNGGGCCTSICKLGGGAGPTPRAALPPSPLPTPPGPADSARPVHSPRTMVLTGPMAGGASWGQPPSCCPCWGMLLPLPLGPGLPRGPAGHSSLV